MTLVDKFFSKVRNNTLGSTVIERWNAFVKGRDLGNSHNSSYSSVSFLDGSPDAIATGLSQDCDRSKHWPQSVKPVRRSCRSLKRVIDLRFRKLCTSRGKIQVGKMTREKSTLEEGFLSEAAVALENCFFESSGSCLESAHVYELE